MRVSADCMRCSAFAMVLACCHGVDAEPLFVDFGETKEVHAETDTVQAGDVTIAPRGAARKTGSGKWTLPVSKLFTADDFRIEAAEGVLSVEPSAAPTQVKPEGTDAILGKAAVWFDSGKEDRFVKDDSGNITDWLDVRETGSSGSYVYPRAVSDTQFFASNPLYPVRQTDEGSGKEALWFHGVKSGCWMKFLTPSDENHTCLAYNVFVVHGVRSGLGNILGLRKGGASAFPANMAFIAGNSSAGTFTPLWMSHMAETPSIATARTYVNGEIYDGMSHALEYPEGFSLLEAEMLRLPGAVNCFFNDRGYVGDTFANSTRPGEFASGGGVRLGGDYIGEVLLFTNRLTSAERLSVESYLMNKWFGVRRPSKLNLAVASSASVEVKMPSAGDESIPWSLSGDGAYIKADTDSTLLDNDALVGFVGHIALGADADVHHRGDYAFCLEPGRRYKAFADISSRYLTSRTDTEAGSADKCVKYGADEMKVDTVSTNVAKLYVDDGTLRLSAPTASMDPLSAAGRRVCAVITNSSFELGVGSGEKKLSDGEDFHGWHCDVPEGSTLFIYNGSYEGGHNAGAWVPMPTNIPDGVCGLGFQNDSSVWTEIEIPEDGTYRFSVRAASRYYKGVTQLGHAFEFAVGTDAENLTTFGRLRTVVNGNNYRIYTYRMPYLTKGVYRLRIKADSGGKDKTTVLDCVSAVREEPGEEWLLPNGNFESIAGGADDFPSLEVFSNANASAVCDWTLEQPTVETRGADYSAGLSYVAPATPIMYASGRAEYDDNPGIFYDLAEGDGTAVNLQLCKGGAASCTFVPPAGEWRLRVDAKTCRFSMRNEDCVDFHATLTVQGEDVDLGTVRHNRVMLKQVDTFPEKISSDGVTPVTVRLWCEITGKGTRQDASDAHLCLDNVRLAPVSDDLIASGGFENGWNDGVWSQEYFSTNRFGYMKCEIIKLRNATDANNRVAYGANLPVGRCALRLLAECIVKQTIVFPTAGDYRMSAIMRSRNSSITGQNPVRAWYVQGNVTNEIFGFFTPTQTNFVRFAWNFRVDTPGESVFAIEGGSPGVDRTTLIDEVSITPVKLAAETPEIGPETRITVAAGAKLRLDYPGTATVSRVRYAGISRSGIVTAASDPEFVTGPGALEVVPLNTRFIIIIK